MTFVWHNLRLSTTNFQYEFILLYAKCNSLVNESETSNLSRVVTQFHGWQLSLQPSSYNAELFSAPCQTNNLTPNFPPAHIKGVLKIPHFKLRLNGNRQSNNFVSRFIGKSWVGFRLDLLDRHSSFGTESNLTITIYVALFAVRKTAAK